MHIFVVSPMYVTGQLLKHVVICGDGCIKYPLEQEIHVWLVPPLQANEHDVSQGKQDVDDK